MGATPGQRYLEHLDRFSGGIEPRLFRVTSLRPDLKGVAAIVYDDVPVAGWLTAMTYGLSLARHPVWEYYRPELCISVASSDELWARAMAEVAEHFRGQSPFLPAETIDYGGPISPTSALSSFVVFEPAVLAPENCIGIDIGDDLPISIAGLYPIHEDERQFIDAHGLEAFWDRDFDPADVHRPSAV